jgi:hypothetical protein
MSPNERLPLAKSAFFHALRRSSLIVSCLCGCSRDFDEKTHETGGFSPDQPDDSGHPDSGETGAPPEPLVTEESGGDQTTVESDWIFDDSLIHEIEIALPNASWVALLTSPYEYAEADVTIDGVEAPEIGVRLRGKIGSFRALTGKPKFKLDFNQYYEGRRFYGLKSLSLENAIVDCSYEKELLALAVIAQAGLPALRIAFANVSVNGVDYGLYLVMDTEDSVFVSRYYADSSGNLYDGKYKYDPTTGSYTLLDFIDSVDDYYQLEEGTDVGLADIFAITNAAASSYGSGDYEGGTGEVVDWPYMHRMLAVEQWIGHNDGYALNTNNNRPYFDPGNAGKMDMLMWDFDYAFLEDSWWGLSWYSPRGTLAAGCWIDPECIAAQQAAAATLASTLDVSALEAKLSMWEALSNDRAYADPRRECGVDSVTSYRSFLHDWLATRPTYMQSFWGY